MPINRRMSKQGEVYSYNGILLSTVKKWTTDAHVWMNSKNNMPSEGSQTWVCSLCSHCYKVQGLICGNITQLWVQEGNTLLRDTKKLSRVKATLCLDWMSAPWICTFLNTHQRAHLRSAHFATSNYTSIKIWKLHTLITPQLSWIFSWFIKWGLRSNMHFWLHDEYETCWLPIHIPLET